MKAHISVTVDETLIAFLRRYAKQEKRSISQVIEIALENFLSKTNMGTSHIVTTPGAFLGSFSREDTYAGR